MDDNNTGKNFSKSRFFSTVLIGCIVIFLFSVYLSGTKSRLECGLSEGYSEQSGMGYYLYLPSDYRNTCIKRYPIFVFLHGSNATGNGRDELLKIKAHGLKAIIHQLEGRNCIVLAPQTKDKWENPHIDLLLDEVIKHYRIDPHRIYLTGVSMGGNGAWSYAADGKHKAAALVPVCGYFYPDENAIEKLRDVPKWIFHGKNDRSVEIENAYQLVALFESDKTECKFTFYEDGAHIIWDRAYDTQELYEWIFSKSRER